MAQGLGSFRLPCLFLIIAWEHWQGAITTMTKGIAQEQATKGIRCNLIAPGPVWTPLVVSSFPSDMVS